MRLKLISCELFSREMATAIARSVNEVEAVFLPHALHARGCSDMRQTLQAALDAVAGSNFHAILLAHGLCRCGVLGLRSRAIPLVLPRVEDCSALLGGSKPPHCAFARSQPGPDCLPSTTAGAFEAWSSLATIRHSLSAIQVTSADRIELQAELEAAWFGWDFEKATGNLAVLQRFMDGFWSHHEFLVVPPGYQIAAAFNEEIIRAEEFPT